MRVCGSDRIAIIQQQSYSSGPTVVIGVGVAAISTSIDIERRDLKYIVLSGGSQYNEWGRSRTSVTASFITILGARHSP